MLDDFVATTAATCATLEQALAARDLDEVRRQAHRIKGAARAVGAARIAVGARRRSRPPPATDPPPRHSLDPLAAQLSDALREVTAAVTSGSAGYAPDV